MATTFHTVPEMFLHRVASTPQQRAFRFPAAGGWKTTTWREFGEQVREVSMGLRALGLGNEDRCAILCSTRYEWILADTGILCAAGATSTIYPSSTPDDCAYILNDSGAMFCFAETDEHVEKLVKKRAELSKLKHVITIDGKASADGWVLTLEQLRERGRAAGQGEFEKVCASVKNDSLATLIYTSGTTGRPKGVELTQDNWMFEGECIDGVQIIMPQDIHFLWLPLSHVFGKVLLVAQLRIGFETAVDGRIDKIISNLAEIQPTFVAAVPRIFEKFYNAVIENAKASSPLKYRIFRWSLGVGREVSRCHQEKRPVDTILGLKHALADRLVLSKVRARFGGRLKYFVSGSAPLSREIAEFLHACGILVLEGYGLTESSAASFVNVPGQFKFGTVGPALPGVQLKIASDGEILLGGRGIMRGYHNLPEQTAESIREGWLYTGDIGEISGDGMLRITDRKKDLIKTSGGKYVAPQALEGRLKASLGLISQVLVHGNNRNFCSALIALDPVALEKWAREKNLGGTYAEWTQHAEIRGQVQQAVDALNATLASFETIKKFSILKADLTEANGDLTPSLKLKRKEVERKHKALLDGFYEGALAA